MKYICVKKIISNKKKYTLDPCLWLLRKCVFSYHCVCCLNIAKGHELWSFFLSCWPLEVQSSADSNLRILSDGNFFGIPFRSYDTSCNIHGRLRCLCRLQLRLFFWRKTHKSYKFIVLRLNASRKVPGIWPGGVCYCANIMYIACNFILAFQFSFRRHCFAECDVTHSVWLLRLKWITKAKCINRHVWH